MQPTGLPTLPIPTSTLPANDEIEITLLGRGVGESCVVHFGNGRWMVVDSFNEAIPRASAVGRKLKQVPAPQVYLESLEVHPDAVEVIVLTHFHADHYRGLDRLHDHYEHARLFVTGALNTRTYRRLFSDQTGHLSGNLPGTLSRAYERDLGGVSGLSYLGAAQLLINDDVVVTALAPSDKAKTTSALELGQVIDGRRPEDVRTFLQDENRTSGALHIAACGSVALLSGDVITKPVGFGWDTVWAEPRHQALARADIVKIAHHGSEEADHPETWTHRLNRDAPMLVAPYWPSSIPRSSDRERLAARGRLCQTSSSSGEEVDEWGNTTAAAPPSTGIIQARRRASESWQIRLQEPAHFVSV